MNDIAVIYLTNGGIAIVDADMYDALNQNRWQRRPDGGVYRGAIVDGEPTTIFMHRIVNATPEGVDTDHINGFRFDNRRSNLRNANKSTNAANSTPRKRKPNSPWSGKYKGVYRRPDCNSKPWVARIGCRENGQHLGYFATQEQAAEAYNKAAISRFGEYAKLNIIS